MNTNMLMARMRAKEALWEYRSFVWNNLLCKIGWKLWAVEIMNKSNRILEYVWPSRVSQDLWPKWTEFQQFSRDLHCSNCKKLLWRALWDEMKVEIKCDYCKTINTFDMKEIYNKLYASLSQNSVSLLKKQLKELIIKR